MIRFLLILCAILFMPLSQAHASEWKEIPIVHDGRIKPIDSFSRIMLKTFSGKEKVDGLDSAEWVQEVLFNPAEAMVRPVFKTQSPDVLDLQKRKSKLYSYEEIAQRIQTKRETIQQLIETDEQSWTGKQHELMRLYQNFILYTQLLRSLTAILPLPFDAPKNIKGDQSLDTYLDLKTVEQKITAKTKSIIARKGTNPEKYSDEELQIADLSFQLRVIEEGGANNTLFKIIPDGENLKNVAWHSPWEIVLEGHGSPQKAEYLNLWKDMAQAYVNNDTQSFLNISQKVRNYYTPSSALKTETLFNAVPLKVIALLSYFISLLLAVAKISKPSICSDKLISGTFIIALFTHGLLIAFRIFILERAPVGTLYESVLFVSFICALITGIAAIRQPQEKRTLTLSIGSLSALLLLYVSGGLASNDTMTPLVAVLNTNFWLTTHVLCITAGYGFCLVAGIMAHIHLWNQASTKNENPIKPLVIMSIIALLFTAIGTALGGIWADQSWGRFWGWDPKENGALLIVLWLVWLLHGRISGHLQEFGFTIGLAAINIIVILAWFGVNLLNVGLHSYGFIEGIAISIAAFITIECTIITALAYRVRSKRPA